jgi:hypothetical protein
MKILGIKCKASLLTWHQPRLPISQRLELFFFNFLADIFDNYDQLFLRMIKLIALSQTLMLCQDNRSIKIRDNGRIFKVEGLNRPSKSQGSEWVKLGMDRWKMLSPSLRDSNNINYIFVNVALTNVKLLF